MEAKGFFKAEKRMEVVRSWLNNKGSEGEDQRRVQRNLDVVRSMGWGLGYEKVCNRFRWRWIGENLTLKCGSMCLDCSNCFGSSSYFVLQDLDYTEFILIDCALSVIRGFP